MKFIDEAEVHLWAGNGGDGSAAFLREKYRPRGGPAGGDGGDGGDVVFRVDLNLSTLLDFKFQPLIRAVGGEGGRGKHQYGKRGEDREVRVPLGTLIYDADTGELIADLNRRDASIIVAHGGRGGLGNMHYATSTNQAPRYHQPGTPGEEKRLRLELRLMADVGLIGFPNVGKSSLIRRVSAARPRVADYPFTTLVPHLGVVRFGEEANFVLADIPGLIEGAHEGHGLGVRFLRHVARTQLLIHLLDIGGLTGRDPMQDYDIINRELAAFDPQLATRPQILVANKLDLLETRAPFADLQRLFAERGIELRGISAATGEGVDQLMRDAGYASRELKRKQAAAEENLEGTDEPPAILPPPDAS